MKILIAKNAGFCMGVRRAVEMVLDAPGKHKNPICTFGPLIHNPQVLNLLREKEISTLDHIPKCGTGTVLIRAHGVPPHIKQDLKKAGYEIIDATCPRVIKVQTIIGKHAKKDYVSIIIGDKNHPEVVGLLGYSEGKGIVVDNMADLESLHRFDKAIIVAQTTQNTFFLKKSKNGLVKDFPIIKSSIPFVIPPQSGRLKSKTWRIQWMPSLWSADTTAGIQNGLPKFQKWPGSRPITLKLNPISI